MFKAHRAGIRAGIQAVASSYLMCLRLVGLLGISVVKLRFILLMFGLSGLSFDNPIQGLHDVNHARFRRSLKKSPIKVGAQDVCRTRSKHFDFGH